jgi:hypothetical protein
MNTVKHVQRLMALTVVAMLIAMPSVSSGREAIQKWELVNPEGIVMAKPVNIAPRNLDTLEGKTVVLRWNGKPNGDILLNRLAELLSKEAPTAKIIKLYDIEPATASYGRSVDAAKAMAKVIQKHRPDIVISSQAD